MANWQKDEKIRSQKMILVERRWIPAAAVILTTLLLYVGFITLGDKILRDVAIEILGGTILGLITGAAISLINWLIATDLTSWHAHVLKGIFAFIFGLIMYWYTTDAIEQIMFIISYPALIWFFWGTSPSLPKYQNELQHTPK